MSMLAVGMALSVLMGGTLGLFGGGGSILTVPILVYVLGMGPQSAIATSLAVVGITSLVGMVQHARAGHVHWREGLLFGAVAMVGAYGGGLVTRFIPGTVLLVLFAGLMSVTGLAMLRRPRGARRAEGRSGAEADGGSVAARLEMDAGRAAAPGLAPTPAAADRPGLVPARTIPLGLGLGAVTGLVGAGGGFLIVPALVLFRRLPVHAAIGTSLLVIALNSVAGLAGHLEHAAIDLHLTFAIAGAAAVGCLVGTALAKRLDASRLRRGFAYFVLAVAAAMIYRELPAPVSHALFVERWPFWAGGAAIGGFVLLFRYATGKALGVSSGYLDACSAPFDPAARRSWRLPFLAGIIGGGALAALLAGGITPTVAMGMFDAHITASVPLKAALFLGGGVLLGFGARLAGGCTSGHSIVGTSLLAPSSLIATSAFMVAGFLVTHLLLAGGVL